MRFVAAFLALCLLVGSAFAQDAKKEEFETLDATIKAVYDVISGPAGQKRDWDRMRSLFQPEARMIAVGKNREGIVRKQVLTVEDYIKGSGPILEQRGFFEKEVARKVEQYGNIAHVFSTYEARQKADDAKPFMRGINSFQLWNDGKRWWVITIYWQSEDPTTPLPDKYLKNGS
jgi:hypothetical protein